VNPEILDRVIDLTLVVGLIGLGLAFGLGTVAKDTSYGLTEVIAVLGVIAGGRFMGHREGRIRNEPDQHSGSDRATSA
jgi:hypothetical protein